jgi:MFS family permease
LVRQTAISTALPDIINDLQGEDYIWVGSAYALTSTAFLPFCGSMANILGRKCPAPILFLSSLSVYSNWIADDTSPCTVLDLALHLPLVGRSTMMLSLVMFMLGSGLCGGARYVGSMDMLIAARAVQGMGGGGIIAMTEISESP